MIPASRKFHRHWLLMRTLGVGSASLLLGSILYFIMLPKPITDWKGTLVIFFFFLSFGLGLADLPIGVLYIRKAQKWYRGGVQANESENKRTE